MTMVVKPRCGQPNICSMETNSSSWVMPVMISGMTSGAFTMPVSSRRPRNTLKTHQGDRGQRAQDHRAGGGGDRRFPATASGAEDLIVVQQLGVPAGREAAPDAHQRRGVEGVGDQHQIGM
jgi:hypothetical protein